MKKLLLSILVFCFVQTWAQSNAYHPFPNNYGDWELDENVYPGSGVITYSSIYYTSGDTIINSINYKKVHYINRGQCYCPPMPLNQVFTTGSYVFAYRNDSTNKKVYIVLQGSTTDSLWYNFNLNIGDSLKGTYSTNGIPLGSPNLHMTVTGIDSVLICNHYYKRFACSCSQPNPFTPVYLTESVGFSTNFITANISENCAFEPYHLYNTSAWSLDDCPNGLGIQQRVVSNQVKIYPTPAKNNFTIETTSTEKQMLFVFDVNGKLVLNQFINGTTTIDASNLNAGVYSVNLTSSTGTVTKKLVIVK